MSYSITVRVYQTQPNAFFSVVEQTVWKYANGGTWQRVDDEYVLTMGGSGTSGTIRFKADTGETFIVALGVHNYERWCDIVTGLSPSDTGVVINPQYYDSGPRAYMREKVLKEYSVKSAQGRQFQVIYTKADGNNLNANIIIG